MITVRTSTDRGHVNFGWLDSRHTFAFGHWRPPAGLPHAHGFRGLRVINQDIVGPAKQGGGFDHHPHHDMEIISYVIEGGLAHEDSTGTRATIRPGDIQRMTAGTGIVHAEFNASDDQPVHFLQIWLLPDRRGHTPGYAQANFPRQAKLNQLLLVGAHSDGDTRGAGGAIPLHANARLYASVLEPGRAVELTLAPGRHAWVQVVKGRARIGDGESEVVLEAGDGAAISAAALTPDGGVGKPGGPVVRLVGEAHGAQASELLVFDLA